MDNIKIRQRLEARATERTALEGIWKIIEKFICPYRTMLFADKNSEMAIDWKLRELYDSTAIFANQNLAASLNGSLTNMAVPWASYIIKAPEARYFVEVQRWLDEVNYIIMEQLQGSNFGLESNELYLDLTSYGIGNLAHMEETNPDGSFKSFNFSALPLDECYFDVDHMGRPINFYRKFYWTSIQIVEKFGRQAVPMEIVDKALSGNRSTDRYEVIYCIYKRQGQEFENVNTFGILTPEKRPYGEKYFLEKDLTTLSDEGGFYEFPSYIPRWRKSTGSIWGWSPSMTAIYDTLTLNELVDLILSAGEKAIDPAIMVTKRGVLGQIDLSAAGVTVVSDPKAMAPFESRARFDVSSLSKQDLQIAIERAYYTDQLQLKESPAMTATEVYARIQLMQRLLGPTFGRLQSDFLGPMLERSFKILYRNRMLPEIPSIILERGWELNIDYLGPLAKSQRLDDAQAIERTLSAAASLQQTFPNITDNFDPDEAIRELGDVLGAPARVWVPRNQMAEERRARAEQASSMQQLEGMQMGGDAIKSIGEGAKAMAEAGAVEA